MDNFPCDSKLRISVSCNEEATQLITGDLEHALSHVPYYDIRLPSLAVDLIRESLWATPRVIAAKSRRIFPKYLPVKCIAAG